MTSFDRETELPPSRKDELPLVSIVTPVYNGSLYLEEFIRSVLAQDYPRIEHIVIDDGSTDGGATVEILKRYPHLRWWSRENRGQYPTMNEGFAAATGDFVTFMNADDLYDGPRAISSLVRVFRDDPRCDAVYGELHVIDSEGKPLPLGGPAIAPIWLLRYRAPTSHACTLVKRKFLLETGIAFDESLRYTSDYDWFNKLVLAGCRFRWVRKPVLSMRMHSGQLSNDFSTPRAVAEFDYLKNKYPYNPILKYLVKRIAALIALINLLRYYGLKRAMIKLKNLVFGNK